MSNKNRNVWYKVRNVKQKEKNIKYKRRKYMKNMWVGYFELGSGFTYLKSTKVAGSVPARDKTSAGLHHEAE